MTEIDINRHNHLVDPHLEIWGPEVAWYLFLGGLVAGVMVFSTLALRGSDNDNPASSRASSPGSKWIRWAPFAAPILLSAGMGLLFLDLELKTHVYRFYFAFKPLSPMSWGAWILVLIYPVTVWLGLLNLTDGEVSRLSEWGLFKGLRVDKVVIWLRSLGQPRLAGLRNLNIALGVALGLYTGILLGTLQARALWSSTLLGPLFLVSGLSTGAAFMMLFPIQHREHSLLRRWDLLMIGTEVVLLLLFFLDRATGGATSQAQIGRFFGGDLTAVFWSLVVVVGLAVPATLELLETRKALKPSLAAPVLVLIGGAVLRWILVAAGQSSAIT